MSTPPVSDEKAIEAVELVRQLGSQVAAADHLRIARSTLQNRLIRAAQRGLDGSTPHPMPEGFEVSRHAFSYDAEGKLKAQSVMAKPSAGEAWSVPEGHRVKGYSALVDATGRTVQQWVKTKEGELDPLWVAEKIRTAFDGMEFAVPSIVTPTTVHEDCLALYRANDLHLGLYVWGAEASENWDLKKALRIYRDAFSEVVGMTPACGTAVLLGGGDQMHADSAANRTEASGHALDVDGRYERVLYETCEFFLYCTALLLQRNERVIVRILKGNHDPHSSAAIAFFLLAAFRHEPRVTVDVSPNLFWVLQFGKVMLASTHGHAAKPQQLPSIMAARWPKMWGETLFRYAHVFHFHHAARLKSSDEIGGATVEIAQSPAPQDAWHYGQGFISGRSFTSKVYHKERGEIGGFTQPILPEHEEAA